MSDDSREAIQLRERAKAAARGVFLGELAELGRGRTEALARVEEFADRIARVLPDALEAGIQLTEIGKVTGVSRPTLYALRARYEDRPLGLNLAVIAALANGSRTDRDLHEAIGQPLSDVLGELQRTGLIESLSIEYVEDPEAFEPVQVQADLYSLTRAGVVFLEAWTFGPSEPDDAELEAEALAEREDDPEADARAEAEAEAWAEAQVRAEAEDGPE